MNAERIHALFNDLAPVYDRGNDLLSLGLARLWRRAAVATWQDRPPAAVLDLACGTGDFGGEVLRAFPACRVEGVDFSEEMIARARRKQPGIHYQTGDAAALPFPDGIFDGATLGWGLRNFTDRPAALKEIARVLKPGGRLLILEAVAPEGRLTRLLFLIYRYVAAPLVGLALLRPKSYAYLMRSMAAMPPAAEFRALLTGAGFADIACRDLCLGMIVRYAARRN